MALNEESYWSRELGRGGVKRLGRREKGIQVGWLRCRAEWRCVGQMCYGDLWSGERG